MLDMAFRPVLQTRLGGKGNCHAACLASIFDVPLEEIPEPLRGSPSEDWWQPHEQWLADRGYLANWYEFQGIDDPIPLGLEFALPAPPAGSAYTDYRPLAILGGQSPRGDFLHAVVYSFPQQRIVWDPFGPSDPVLLNIVDLQVFRDA